MSRGRRGRRGKEKILTDNLLKIGVLALVALAAVPAGAADVTGKAEVVDGNTLAIGGERIRLDGIDAPDPDQQCLSGKGKPYACGTQATGELAGLVVGHTLVCKGEERDGEDRLIAVCFLGPFDLAEMMVADGWALADPERGGAYVRAETAARARREGLWKGTFDPPWEWREKRK
jgi:endonuclease YncB( thermonuclease family)